MRRFLIAIVGCLMTTMSAEAVDTEHASPESRARVAAYYSAFQIAAMNGTPSPCPIEGLDLESLGVLNRWIDERASTRIVNYFENSVDEASQLLAGHGFVFGDASVRQTLCKKLRWEAQAYDLFER